MESMWILLAAVSSEQRLREPLFAGMHRTHTCGTRHPRISLVQDGDRHPDLRNFQRGRANRCQSLLRPLSVCSKMEFLYLVLPQNFVHSRQVLFPDFLPQSELGVQLLAEITVGPLGLFSR